MEGQLAPCLCLIPSVGCQGERRDPALLCLSCETPLPASFVLKGLWGGLVQDQLLCPVLGALLTVVAHFERDMSPLQWCHLMKLLAVSGPQS